MNTKYVNPNWKQESDIPSALRDKYIFNVNTFSSVNALFASPVVISRTPAEFYNSGNLGSKSGSTITYQALEYFKRGNGKILGEIKVSALNVPELNVKATKQPLTYNSDHRSGSVTAKGTAYLSGLHLNTSVQPDLLTEAQQQVQDVQDNYSNEADASRHERLATISGYQNLTLKNVGIKPAEWTYDDTGTTTIARIGSKFVDVQGGNGTATYDYDASNTINLTKSTTATATQSAKFVYTGTSAGTLNATNSNLGVVGSAFGSSSNAPNLMEHNGFRATDTLKAMDDLYRSELFEQFSTGLDETGYLNVTLDDTDAQAVFGGNLKRNVTLSLTGNVFIDQPITPSGNGETAYAYRYYADTSKSSIDSDTDLTQSQINDLKDDGFVLDPKTGNLTKGTQLYVPVFESVYTKASYNLTESLNSAGTLTLIDDSTLKGDYEADFFGSIAASGFLNVSVSDSEVNDGIVGGTGIHSETTTLNSTPGTPDAKTGIQTITTKRSEIRSFSSQAGGTFAATDSQLDDISGYQTVTLNNTSAEDLERMGSFSQTQTYSNTFLNKGSATALRTDYLENGSGNPNITRLVTNEQETFTLVSASGGTVNINQAAGYNVNSHDSIDDISGAKNVNILNAHTDDISSAPMADDFTQSTQSTFYSATLQKDGTVTATGGAYNNMLSVLGGTLTARNTVINDQDEAVLMVMGDINLFATVTLNGGIDTGDIDSMVRNNTESYSTTYAGLIPTVAVKAYHNAAGGDEVYYLTDAEYAAFGTQQKLQPLPEQDGVWFWRNPNTAAANAATYTQYQNTTLNNGQWDGKFDLVSGDGMRGGGFISEDSYLGQMTSFTATMNTKANSTAKVTTTGVSADEIDGFATATLSNTNVERNMVGGNSSHSSTQSYSKTSSTASSGVKTYTEKESYSDSSTTSAVGKLTMSAANSVEGSIIGYNTVVLTGLVGIGEDISAANSDSRDGVPGSSTYSATQTRTTTIATNGTVKAVNVRSAGYNSSYAAVGSLSAQGEAILRQPDPQSISIGGSIRGYLNVTLSGTTVAANIIGGSNSMVCKEQETETEMETRGRTTRYTTQFSLNTLDTESAIGSLAASYLSSGSAEGEIMIQGYKTVTLQNFEVGGIYGGNEVGGRNGNAQNYTFTGSEKTGYGTVTGSEKRTSTAVGALTATNGEITDEVLGYLTVKLNNVTAENICGGNAAYSLAVTGTASIWMGGDAYLYYRNYLNFQATESDTRTATGTLTATNSTLDDVLGYQTVSISYIDTVDSVGRLVNSVGDIIGGVTAEKTVTTGTRSGDSENIRETRQITETMTSTGSVTVSNAGRAGNVLGYLTANISNTDCIGDLIGGNTTWTATFDQVDSGAGQPGNIGTRTITATGKATLTDVDHAGEIVNYKEVVINGNSHLGGIYVGEFRARKFADGENGTTTVATYGSNLTLGAGSGDWIHVGGTIGGYTAVTVNGKAFALDFYGTAKNDTLTVKAGAGTALFNNIDFSTGTDKMVLNAGSIFATSADFDYFAYGKTNAWNLEAVTFGGKSGSALMIVRADDVADVKAAFGVGGEASPIQVIGSRLFSETTASGETVNWGTLGGSQEGVEDWLGYCNDKDTFAFTLQDTASLSLTNATEGLDYKLYDSNGALVANWTNLTAGNYSLEVAFADGAELNKKSTDYGFSLAMVS